MKIIKPTIVSYHIINCRYVVPLNIRIMHDADLPINQSYASLFYLFKYTPHLMFKTEIGSISRAD